MTEPSQTLSLASKLRLAHEIASYLAHEVETQDAIFISGMAGTGRTTLLNALIHLLPSSVHVCTINFMSDAESPNVTLMGGVSDNQKLLSAETPEMINALRHGADLIAVDEAQFIGREALINYVATGTSVWATIHASSLSQAASILSQALPEHDTAPFKFSIIHLQTTAGERIGSVEIYHHGEDPGQTRKYTNE